MDATTSEIVAFYEGIDEDSRLSTGFGSLEKVRTQELIARYLVGEELEIVEVGGATGAYSFWLASLGHRVHLLDIVPKHIQIARQKAQTPSCAPLASMVVGDARALPYVDACADVVITHGPLYHLTRREDRIASLAEARRVLKPQGTILAFTITRYAGINYAITEGLVYDPTYYDIMKGEVVTGLCDNDPPRIKTFSRAYFHLPSDIREEIIAARLAYEKTIGVMGTAWLVPSLDESWKDSVKRERILEIARLLENEPVLGPRMLTVARK